MFIQVFQTLQRAVVQGALGHTISVMTGISDRD